MPYSHNLPRAAYRHREAADQLDGGTRRDVAGYLYGIAAECAVKYMALRLPLPPGKTRDQIFYAHFPELRTLIREALVGRRGSPLAKFVDRDDFMNEWNVAMRYADAGQISDHRVDRWRAQARDVVNAMES